MKISKKKFEQKILRAKLDGFLEGFDRGTDNGISYTNDRFRNLIVELEMEIEDNTSPND